LLLKDLLLPDAVSVFAAISLLVVYCRKCMCDGIVTNLH